MAYKITIVKTEPNPQFKEELAKYQENRRTGYYDRGVEDAMRPKEETIDNALMVELTDEQYVAVKKEIIKAFE